MNEGDRAQWQIGYCEVLVALFYGMNHYIPRMSASKLMSRLELMPRVKYLI